VSVRLLVGDARETLATLEPGSVQCCVTSPPYWRQRDYQMDGQIGQEPTPELWVCALVDVMRLVRTRLAMTGVLWLNVGDKYAAGGLGGGGMASKRKNWRGTMGKTGWRAAPHGYKPKDLTLLPFKLAEALRVDGWYLRATIVWEKAAAVEPPRLDRPSVSHEYVFLLSVNQDTSVRYPGEPWWYTTTWRIPQRSDASHPAVMPSELARRCIVASTHAGDTVLDPFAGYGTVPLEADRHARNGIGIELNDAYATMATERVVGDAPLFTEVSA
jgi:site-specific DNA-methyltransferase (cytosine-N4-specific)